MQSLSGACRKLLREQRELGRLREYLKAPQTYVLSVDDNEMNLAVVRGLLKRTEIQ